MYSSSRYNIAAVWLGMLWCCLTLAPAALGQITLDRPGDREYVRDSADVLTAVDEKEIKQRCNRLLSDQAIPIIVVTIESKAEHGGGAMSIETFARVLFDQWEIGHPLINGVSWNKGILLLVSVDDREARIELGADWGHAKDALTQQIMDERIIPAFRSGDYAGGISLGVEALDAMAREKPLPSKPMSLKGYAIAAGVIGLLVFTIVSLARRGTSGWAALFWGAVFALVGMVLYHLVTSRGSSSSGGFSGGSFGGGSSGGGGASGSW